MDEAGAMAFSPNNKYIVSCSRKGTVYAWDVSNNGTRVSNKRAFYLASSWVPDGLKVSREGLVLTATSLLPQ